MAMRDDFGGYGACTRISPRGERDARVIDAQVAIPELLAPAGSFDALCAALAAGADAVYCGLGAFNARAGNAGLSLRELSIGCDLAHARGASVYVAFNVYLRDAELDEVVELAGAAMDAGADALIVADPGLCLRLRETMPDVELHLSTQAGVQCAEAALFVARELGVDRVTCARELSVAEIGSLCATGVPIEAFCHGAICICYSGACSYSALLRGRSANRGDCSQPCRLAYELQDARGRRLAGGVWERTGDSRDAPFGGDRLLCPRDYLGIRHIPALMEARVSSLKIEGRMKGPDYVFNVVGAYRTALDAAAAGHPLDVEALAMLEQQLARSFSRGFTDGYLRGTHMAIAEGFMSRERAINQGVPVGSLVDRGCDEVTVALTGAVGEGDMLEIRSTPGPDAPADVPKRWPIVVCPRDAASGERLILRCKRKVELGSAVHLVRCAHVLAEASRAVEELQAEAVVLGDRVAKVHRTSGDGRASMSRLSAEARAQIAGSVPIRPADAFDLGEVCRTVDIGEVRRVIARGDVIICRNYAHIALALAEDAQWEAATPLSVWNAETVRWLLSLGARRVWLPEELAADAEISICDALADRGYPDLVAHLGRPLSGSTPLMITEHCLLTVEGPCTHECVSCPRRLASSRGERFLVELDRKSSGARLRVKVDRHGRTRLYREISV